MNETVDICSHSRTVLRNYRH